MRILLTNDDGIHAEGLAALERIARQFSDEVWIVAPQSDQSGVAHSLSLHDPLRVTVHDDKRFSVRGTPTDCVIMAIDKLMPEKPDLVLSGINSGQNIAEDITYSGTVAGAIEGTLLGVRSIALSQAYSFQPGSRADYGISERCAPAIIRKLIDFDMPNGTYFNVNFPDAPREGPVPIMVTRQGKKNWDAMYIDERQDGRGTPYFWLAFRGSDLIQDDNTDLRAIKDGYVSVTPLKLDMTDQNTLEKLSVSLND